MPREGIKLGAEEIKLRGTLLSSNKELLQLHRTLVRGGFISEEEFWETRQSLLKSQETLLGQKKPLPSQLGGELETSTGIGGDQKIILTPETIQSILQQNPAVSRAHKAVVPTKMGEKEFWTYYVRSKFFAPSSNRSRSGDGSEDNPLNEYYEEASQQDDEATSSRDVAVSRAVDLTATAEDHHSDVVNRAAQYLRSQRGDETISLIKKFNNHSLKILNTCVGKYRPVRIEDALELEDLSAPSEATTVPLKVKEADADGPATSDFDLQASEEFTGRLQATNLGILDFALSQFRKHEQIAAIVTAGRAVDAPTPAASRAPLTPDVEMFHSNAAEVLRHFWSCYPPGRDADRQAKLQRMTTILEQLAAKAKSLVTLRQNLQERVDVEMALSGILDAVDFAIDKQANRDVEHHGKRIKLNE